MRRISLPRGSADSRSQGGRLGSGAMGRSPPSAPDGGAGSLSAEQLEKELQSSLRWACVGFESLAACETQGEEDPLVEDAFERACFGLLATAARLPVDPARLQEALRSMLGSVEEQSESEEVEEVAVTTHVENNNSTQNNNCENNHSTQNNNFEEGESSGDLSSWDDMKPFLCGDLPTFSAIAALDDVKRLLHEAVVLPQQCPSLFQGVRQPWKGILLYGPPGTGKTQLAKAIAGESRATFMLLSPSNLLSKFVGEAERALSRVFAFAKDKAPTVLFFDEIDAIGSSRGSGDQALRRLAELLQQFSSLKPSDRVVVLAATNRIEDIDPALLRRFERKFHVGLLTGHARGELLRLKMVGTPTAPDLDYKQLGRRTDGFSGASLELLCREASMYGIRELLEVSGDLEALLRAGAEVRPVTARDFDAALSVMMPGTVDLDVSPEVSSLSPVTPKIRRTREEPGGDEPSPKQQRQDPPEQAQPQQQQSLQQPRAASGPDGGAQPPSASVESSMRPPRWAPPRAPPVEIKTERGE